MSDKSGKNKEIMDSKFIVHSVDNDKAIDSLITQRNDLQSQIELVRKVYSDSKTDNIKLRTEVELLNNCLKSSSECFELERDGYIKLQAENEKLKVIMDLDKTYTTQSQVIYARVCKENSSLKAEVERLTKQNELHVKRECGFQLAYMKKEELKKSWRRR